jgi:hypothetical protein
MEVVADDQLSGLQAIYQYPLHKVFGTECRQFSIEAQAQQVVDLLRFEVGDFLAKTGQSFGRLVGRKKFNRLWFEDDDYRGQVAVGGDPA